MDTLALSPQEIYNYVYSLTPRQREIITHIARGKSDKELSTILSIKVDTVRRHITNARLRVGAENRTQLIAIMVAWKYVEMRLT